MEERIDGGLVPQIDLISMLKDIAKEWWAILLLSLAVALFADIWVNVTYQPEYKTSTTFVVTAKGMNTNVYQNLNSTQQLAQQFTEIMDSNVLKKKVAQDLKMSSLNIDSSVDLVPETNLITLSVKAGTAVESYRILQSIMKNYNTVSDYAIKNVIIETIQSPAVSMAPVNPLNEKKTMIIAFIAAAAVFMVLVAGLSYLRDTIKNPKDVTSKLDTRLLGSIYHEKKSKSIKLRKKKEFVSMLISNPLRSFQYAESNKMMSSRVRSYMDKENAKTLLVTSVMENEGKSTVAANLALGLAQEGSRVMLIDCDFRKPAQYKIFDMEGKDADDLGKVLTGKAGTENLICNWNDTNLYMILNRTSSNSIEALLKSTTLRPIVGFCRQNMDYVIIDTSPLALVSDTEELAQMADASVLVVRQDTVLTKDINDAIDILNNTRGKVLGCVLNDASSSQITGSTAHYGYGGYYEKRA
ncbi:polysaccharide biosynthesis tyrosine autokinase [Blautia wexlerae]|uniref:polysaccharide biosynthesis tyrosine autokinase n=1 Tax=Blautia wexlerae TaxID=418240 RepID=UPI0018AADA8D|nr:polysaccharide biosynthesis tyrosine autokinase [Blautia wexlerae]MDB2176319.1 polysaccharide biosynthesis tyrosine autokinase [Blautia wexlerae]MDB6439667.1 polysaccharide biosynthesis tyrosine autokinase [Blautia wexlerae]